jgi:hypothetical protein
MEARRKQTTTESNEKGKIKKKIKLIPNRFFDDLLGISIFIYN